MTEIKRRRRAEPEETQEQPEITQPYVPYVQPFQSAHPEDPNAQPTFTNESAWQPTYDDEQDAPEAALDSTDDLAQDIANDPTLYLTEEEQAEMRQNHWRLLSGLGDFVSIIVGCVVILVLITMLVSLLNWLYSDVLQSISLFQTMM